MRDPTVFIIGDDLKLLLEGSGLTLAGSFNKGEVVLLQTDCGEQGISFLKENRQYCEKIVLIGDSFPFSFLCFAFLLGIRGFVKKRYLSEEIVEAIKSSQERKFFLGAEVLEPAQESEEEILCLQQLNGLNLSIPAEGAEDPQFSAFLQEAKQFFRAELPAHNSIDCLNIPNDPLISVLNKISVLVLTRGSPLSFESLLAQQPGIQLYRAKLENLAEKIESLFPEILVFPVEGEQNLERLRSIASQFPNLAILATGISTFEAIVPALEAGATGAVSDTATPQQISLALQAVIQDSLMYGPQGEDIRFIVLPHAHQQQKLPLLFRFLTIRLIEQCRSQKPSDLPEPEEFLYKLGLRTEADNNKVPSVIADLEKLSGEGTIFEELDRKIGFLRVYPTEDSYRQKPKKYLDSAEEELRSWFFGSAKTVATLAAQERLLYRSSGIKNSTLSDWQELIPFEAIGTYTLVQWMEEGILCLRTLAREYDQSKQAALEKSTAASMGLNVLKNKIKTEESSRLLESAFTALQNYYHNKIEAEIYGAAESLASEVSQHLQSYLKTFQASDRLLYEIVEQNRQVMLQSKFQKPSFKMKMPAAELRREVEQLLGHKLYNWGAFEELSKDKIQQAINKMLYPFVFRIYISSTLDLDTDGFQTLSKL